MLPLSNLGQRKSLKGRPESGEEGGSSDNLGQTMVALELRASTLHGNQSLRGAQFSHHPACRVAHQL